MKKNLQGGLGAEGFYAIFGLTAFLAVVVGIIVLRPLTTRTIQVEDEHRLPVNSTATAEGETKPTAGGAVQRGENLTIPPNFPSDVPVYPGAKVGAVTQVAAADASSLLLRTSDDISTVAAWYEANAGAWTLGESERGQVRQVRRFTKEGYRLVVTAEPKEGVTEVTVVRTKKEEVK